MKDLKNIYFNKKLQNELSYFNEDNNPCHGIDDVSIICHKKNIKKRKKNKLHKYAQQPTIVFRLSGSRISNNKNPMKRHSSMPELNKSTKLVQPRTKSAVLKKNKNLFKANYTVNLVSEQRITESSCPFNYPGQMKWKIYRCQLSTAEETCCCSCNSDAMFEVMKSLYDCYKKKNCDDCECILCSHQHREERRLGELRKSLAEVGLEPTPSEKKKKAEQKKAEKLLQGKSPAEKEQILKDLVKAKKPLPEGKTASEKALIKKVRTSLGLPPEPRNAAEKAKLRKAEAAGIVTPLEGKTPEQKERILRGLAMEGVSLPEGRTPSEAKLIDKVRTELGLPPEPKTEEMKDKYARATKAGLMQPLEGKTPAQKEKILQGLHDMGIPLPEGRTASEKSLIAKIKSKPVTLAPSEKMRQAKAKGLLTPLEGKTPEQKEKILKGLAMAGIPLPEGKTASEKKLIDKVRTDLGLPPEPKNQAMKDKYVKAAEAGLLVPLEGKSPKEKERILKGLQDMGIPLPEGRTPSEKALVAKVKAAGPALDKLAPSERMRRAKAAGLITPLQGKSPEQKEKILKGLAMHGIPLPEGKSASEKKLIDKVRADLGLPPEPKTPEMRDKYEKAANAGLLQPLEGKTRPEKEKILQGLHDMGIPLPEGRTASEKSLIAKIKAKPVTLAPSEKMRRAKAAGLLTPLEGKSPEQKEKILKGLAMAGIPLPEGKTASDKKLIDKLRADLGLPPEPKNKDMRDKYAKAADAGLLVPLEGKSPKEKERILKGLQDMGIPLPEGRTPSEKALVAKVKAAGPALDKLAPSERMRRAKAAGLITPLQGKSPEQKEKILKGLAMHGIPLPEGKSASEKKLIDKVRADLGLPPEPKTPEMRDKYEKAANAGLLQPLEGKTRPEKEKILQGLHDMGIPLPEGRTASEKSLIAKIKAKPVTLAPSEKMRRAKAAGLLTPLEGKSPEQKEKILKGLAMAGIPLPEGKTASEKKLIDKVRADLGLPPEPKNKAMRDKYAKAADAGLLVPLEGKSPKEKERILKGLQEMGIPLPEGRTPSEKALVAKLNAAGPPLDKLAPSERMRRAKAAGLITPLQGKSPEQKEKILKGLAMHGIPLPEGKSASEKKLIDKVRADLGLPPEPKTPEMRDKYEKAANAGLLQPLEGKTRPQKEKILQGLHDMGIPLPEGRTASEKSLIAKIKAKPVTLAPSEKMRRAKAAGLLTPLEGKSPEQKEKILKGLAMAGIPLPEGKTASEKKLIDKVRAGLGLPPEPKNKAMRDKYAKAADAGLLVPLEGKSPKEKERILKGLQDMGIPLPEGRTASEKSLIAKIKAKPVTLAPSEKMRRAKAAGLLTPLEGKSPEQKEKILKGLAMAGIPLPEGKTASEKKLIDKVRADLGLPPEPKNKAMRDKYAKAADAGLLVPLEGKSPKEKERILKGLQDMGIPLPEGRTPSEKALVAKLKAAGPPLDKLAPSERMRRAKAAGLITPLQGKTPEQKEKILKGLAMHGIPLPEGKSASEKKLIDKVRADLGLPPEPKTPEMKDKYEKAANAGLLQPLEGKTRPEKEKILQGLHDMGIPLPEGRTASEKSLIAKIKAKPVTLAPSEKMRRAKAAGLLTPLEGKSPEQKEKILKGLAMAGIPLPEGKTASEKKLIDKVRADLGLPPEPKNKAMRDKYTKAADAGLLVPLEGKSPKEKERILKGLQDMGIPLPEGRTPSEKALVAKLKAAGPPLDKLAPSERMRRAKAAGLITPLQGKTPEQKEKILKGLAMHGIPLPEGKSASEKKLIDKVRADLGLPPEPKTPEMKDKYEKAANAGLLQPLEGKTRPEKEKILQGLHDMGIPLPEGRTASEKSLIAKIKAKPVTLAPSEKMRRAKAAGLLTPLEGKSPEQKEKILKGLAMAGIPLPEGKTASEKKLIDKVRADLGLPPEPKNKAMRDKYAKAADAGLLVPLEGKSPKEKERILKGLQEMGIPLPEGRTPSEKALVAKLKAAGPPLDKLAPSERMRRAKAAGLITPLQGKTPEQKEKILKGLAMHGIPLPEGKSASEKKLIDKVRANLGLPPEPKTPEMRDKYEKAANAGLLQPLEGKTRPEKEKILQGLHDMGIPLPEGRTASEKSLIAKIKAKPVTLAPSEKMRRAKAAGLLTPLEGKSPEQKEKILKGLAMAGIPLPEGKTASEKKLIDKVRADLGLPPEPKNKAMRDKYAKAADAGLLVPLEGKSPKEKERILKGLQEMGIPLPEGRTPSEKALVAKLKAAGPPLDKLAPSERMRRAKAAGLITPLQGKTPEQKEKILKGLAMHGIPLPEGKSASEKKLIDKVRADLGLPPEPKTPEMKDKYEKAANAGLLQPLEGKTRPEKEKILQGLHDMGIPLPEGRTASEKSLIAKIKAKPVTLAPSEKMRRAKAAGLLTPLEGKSPEQKEKILKGLAMAGIPLPEGKTASQKKIIDKVRAELGLPPEPKNKDMRDKYAKAADAGLLLPLEGKSPKEKERILKGLHDMGIPLPEGRTPSEKALVAKVMAAGPPPDKLAPSERMRRAKAAGLLTPLEGKTPEQKEKILKGLAMHGIPLPEGKTASEKKLIDKVRADLGLPPEPKTPEMRDKYGKAAVAGLLQPLEGKTPAQKEKILQGLHDMGIPLPEGRTSSEKSLIAKIKAKPRVLTPSERRRQAKSAGLMTPLEGKTPEQKEKILKGLAMTGMPLPEGKTPSEKKLIDKIRTELGLPPEPTTSSMKGRHAKASDAGLLQPLEGKSAKEKEKILKGLADLGIPLPEGRTPSEKALIAKVKGKAAASITTDKIRKAKAAGLLTPLKGKTPEQKEKILKGLAKAGLPLPEGRTASEKALINKVKKEFGIPERTPSEKVRKAKAAGLLTPLEGKTPAQKEKILRGRAAAGLPLPVGRTASERALIQKIKDDTGFVTPSPSERLRKAKAAGLITPLKGKSPSVKEKILRNMLAAGVPIPEGETPSEKEMIKRLTADYPPPTLSQKMKKAKAEGLLTPLKGKTPEQKKKILKSLIKAGLPLPEPQSASEKNLMDKIRQEVGLPPEPKTPSIKEKYKKALADGIITPLEGKTPAEKEKILKKLHDAGIPLPEGRTPSEKEMIKKIKASPRKKPPKKTLSEKIRKAKAEGLITPLAGKTPEQKEKIMRGLAEHGLPLPEAKTASEKKLAAKIRKELGLPPEPKTPSMKERHEKAAAAGVLVPLEGLSPAEKERVLRAQADHGLPLPEGRTPSEKALIAKIKAEQEPQKIPPEKLQKAKEAGLLTPLEGKTSAQKEKIIRGLAEAGLPLPEGKTASEKSLLHRIRTELGIAPPATTPSEKAIVRKAKADGLFTPLTGKTPAQKEKILRGLAEAGLPLPVGKTPSEKELIKKIRTESGLPPLPTPSEKMGKIKKKSKKIGVTSEKLAAKGAGEGFADVMKGETCDRGCGCDKKKIRFKHSYVKIRVTSPDISALCPCPDECIPGVKAGAFIDNEGIKVTVGSAVGVPSYSREVIQIPDYDETIFNHNRNYKLLNKQITERILSDKTYKKDDLSNSMYEVHNYETYPSRNNVDYFLDTTSSDESRNSVLVQHSIPYDDTESDRKFYYFNRSQYERRAAEPNRFVDTSRRFKSSVDVYKEPVAMDYMITDNSRDSFDSILVIKSETSLSLTTNSSESTDTVSEMLSSNCSVTSNSTHYFGYQLSNDLFSNSSTEGTDSSTNGIHHNAIGTLMSDSDSFANESTILKAHPKPRKRGFAGIHKQGEYIVFRMSQTHLTPVHKKKDNTKIKTKTGEPIVVINHWNKERDIRLMVDELLTKEEFSNASSIFLVVPSDDNDAGNSSDGQNSTICIQMSEHHAKWNCNHNIEKPDMTQRRMSNISQGVRISAKGKKFLMDGLPTTIISYHNKETMFDYHSQLQQENKKTKNKLCQITTPNDIVQVAEQRWNVVATDTTADRPCCCPIREYATSTSSYHGFEANDIMSKQITPLLVKQGINYVPIRKSGKSLKPQASFTTLQATPVVPCQVPPCQTVGPRQSKTNDLNITKGPQVQPCHCTPERLRELLEQAVKAGRMSNMTSTGCGGANASPTCQTPATPGLEAPTSLSPGSGTKGDCDTCSHPVNVDECECSGIKTKVKPPCPCGEHQPPKTTTEPGQKAECLPGQTGDSPPAPPVPCSLGGPVNTGSGPSPPGTNDLQQPTILMPKCAPQCTSNRLGRYLGLRKQKKASKTPVRQMGPAGESTFTQAGTKQTRFSSTIGTSTDLKYNCACKNNGKKKKSIICECPEPEPEPPMIQPEWKEPNTEYEWVDQAVINKMKSGLTETVSGFKMSLKPPPPPPPPPDPNQEYTLDDAIRYYAMMKPDLFRQIVQEQQITAQVETPTDQKQDSKKAKVKIECECPPEEEPPPVKSEPLAEGTEQTESKAEEEDERFRGLKFRIGGKGSGSPGLAGICCFDLLQESFTTW